MLKCCRKNYLEKSRNLNRYNLPFKDHDLLYKRAKKDTECVMPENLLNLKKLLDFMLAKRKTIFML